MTGSQYASIGASRLHAITMAALLLFAPISALADEGVINGFFRGNETVTTGIGLLCPQDPSVETAYQVFEQVTVTMSGDYLFSNTGHHIVFDSAPSQIAFYTAFNPSDPMANRVGWTEIESTFEEGAITLVAGTEYIMVVQLRNCFPADSAREEWSFVYRGPGQLNGTGINSLPAYGSGTLMTDAPMFNSPACGNVRYELVGPIQVPESAVYLYSDAAVHFALDVEVYFYANSFDPASPFNDVAFLDDGGEIALEAGTDYYLVVVPWGCGTETGEYQFVLLGPSGEFVITEGVNGTWANFGTLGQGQLMEAFPDRKELFSAWFTWDTTQPDEGETAAVGDPNNRWLTAQGGFSGDTAALELYRSHGGLFDDPAPVENEPVGTMTIQFTSCSEAIVSYTMGGLSGAYTMNRLAADNIVTCENLRAQHKVPVQ